MPTSPRPDTRFTLADFMRFPNDGKRHEIIDGEHYVTPSPNMRHQAISGRLFLAIGNFLAANPHLGRVFYAPFDVILSNHDVVEPDLLVIAADQLDILTPKNVRGAPAIVVEVLSPGTRRVDKIRKRRLFERSGVREYWLVDPELDLIKVFRLGADESFPRAIELTGDDVLQTPILPGLAVALADLFAPT